MALTKELALDKIKAEAPARWRMKARWNYFGRIATELAGGEVGYSLPGDDAAKPARWHAAPAHTLRGVERIARTRRTQEILAASEVVAADFGDHADKLDGAIDRLHKITDEYKENNNGKDF
jgi:hypothetical protein